MTNTNNSQYVQNVQNVPESFTKFKERFFGIAKQTSLKPGTIFYENNILESITEDTQLLQENYEHFEKNYKMEYLQHSDPVRKQEIMEESIRESFIVGTFTNVLDHLIQEGNMSFGKQLLLEDTATTFNIDLGNLPAPKEKVVGLLQESEIKQLNDDREIIEENLNLAAGALMGGAASIAGMPLTGALAITGAAAFAFSWWLPARKAEAWNNRLTSIVNSMVQVTLGAGGLLTAPKHNKFPGLKKSNNTIIKFDNIDSDPAALALFRKIQLKNMTVKEAADGIQVLVMQCLEQNRDVINVPEDTSTLGGLITKSQYQPKDSNILKLLFQSVMANNDKKDTNTLIKFRKCLSTKLTDFYKLVLIATLKDRKDHKNILKTITSTKTNPENLINFNTNDIDIEEELRLKDAIMALIAFREHLFNMGQEMKKGFFTVDKESGEFLLKKLDSVDKEVETYLRTHYKADNTFGGSEEKKTYPKRDLLGSGTRI